MKVTAIHGYVAFVQREPEEKVTREEAAEFLNEIALAIVSAGDIGDPKAQFFRAAIEKAVREFTQPGGDTKPISAREAARRRMSLDGADAQALEGALTLTERERDEARAHLAAVEKMLPREAYISDKTLAENLADWIRDLRHEAKERSEFAAAETAHANRWAERAHAAEKRCKEIGDEAELAQGERDALKEELEKLHRLAPTGTYTANATYEMQIADLKFRLEQAEEELRGEREDYKRLRDDARAETADFILRAQSRFEAIEQERDEARAEVKRLRALLAEARGITQDSLDSNTTGFEDVNEVCLCDSCERYRSIIQRIDAALAEPVRIPEAESRTTPQPVRDWQPHESVGRTEYVARVERECDELKAKLTLLARHYSPEAAAKLRAELAAANAEIASLRWDRETACENTPTKDCECPGCCTARERAERGEA